MPKADYAFSVQASCVQLIKKKKQKKKNCIDAVRWRTGEMDCAL